MQKSITESNVTARIESSLWLTKLNRSFAWNGFWDVRSRLEELGGEYQAELRQVDSYFAHPARDFAVTDEALRIRQANGDCYITYKGPKIDATTKTRREIELPLPSGPRTCEQFTELLESLGFRRLVDVCNAAAW